jgi:RNA polymerase sigma factor (sigma-70 family)
MKKKYSLSKNEIIELEQATIKEICSNVLISNNDSHLIDDLVQDVSLILLNQSEETIQTLFETSSFSFYVARVVTNQVLSNTSPFHSTYRLREAVSILNREEYDFRLDEVWYKAMNLTNDMAKTIVYLRFEYGLKIKEIAILKGVSPRYVHKVLSKTYETLKKDL